MGKVVICLVLMLVIYYPVIAKGNEVEVKKEVAAPPAPEVKASDKEKKATLSQTPVSPEAEKETGRGAEEVTKGASTPSTSRDFLKLTEPKPLTGKKQPKKNVPWGGYWSAVFRDSPEEEDEPTSGGLELKPPQPKKAQPTEQPHSLAEYKEVDYARFASGSYASDYGDKYVKFRCRFARLAPEGMRLQDFPPPEYLNFMVVGKGSSMESLTVAVRAGLADRVFRMESGRDITLYGLAHRLGLSGLTLIVDEIEESKK